MKKIGTSTITPESKPFERSDEFDLLERIRRGDQRAFGELVADYEKRVYRICWRFFMNEEDALDAVQDVFLRVYKAIGGFEGRASLATWIYRIASNTCISIAEKKKREKEGLLKTFLDWWTAESQTTPEEEILGREVQQLNQKMVSEKVALLPEAYRMAVILKDMEGLSLEKIAEILDLPIGTVKSRINRGRRILQESLQGYVQGRLE
ncbi:MAG: sigma-70 family RNA polymerase sigma factor [Candidatus Riflebacteria bacterium]|nr:sigma-70 family RNA polymerase sigma factor [Candidatus Riflebacteria bacterium]